MERKWKKKLKKIQNEDECIHMEMDMIFDEDVFGIWFALINTSQRIQIAISFDRNDREGGEMERH